MSIALHFFIHVCLILGPTESPAPNAALHAWLQLPRPQRPDLLKQPFAKLPLSRAQARQATQSLWDDLVRTVQAEHADEWRQRLIRSDKFELRIDVQRFGDKPHGTRSLFISMHGGGNMTAQINDRQWENQKRLYRPTEGVYIAPRAPTNSWNMWHQPHIDVLFERLIVDAVVFEGVDANRVYLTGYSAGGDGVYQLAPRLADKLAAAAMMAGHPNDAQPLNLRNLPFAIHVGENDGAFNRNQVAVEWGKRLSQLRRDDLDGYVHIVQLHQGKGHWMDRQDASAIAWMAGFTRQPCPSKVVWQQTPTTRPHCYWLAGAPADFGPGARATAGVSNNRIDVQLSGARSIDVCLDDRLVDLDRPVQIAVNHRIIHDGKLPRTIAVIAASIAERQDAASSYCARIAAKP